MRWQWAGHDSAAEQFHYTEVGMLVLSAKCGEKVVVWLENGKKLEITPIKRRGEGVRLGFVGGPEFHIDREPVYRAKQHAAESLPAE